MRCNEAREFLSAFLDDELDPVRSREIEEHVRSCADCAAALGGLRQLGERLRAEAPYYRASDSLRARVGQAAWQGASRGRAASPRRAGVLPRAWLGAAAVVLVVLGATWIFTSLERQAIVGSMEREVVSSHIRSLMAAHLTDVASTDQHTVKPWFNGRLDFSPTVSDLSASGYPLVGGRLDYLGGRPVAALVYQRRKHWINVFTWPLEGARESRASAKTQQGYHLIHATHGGMAYWIVSDLDPRELSEFAGLLLAGGAPQR